VTSRTQPKLKAVIEIFDKIGKRQFPQLWNGAEARAIRLGKRVSAHRATWDRGKAVQRLLVDLIMRGDLRLEYYPTDDTNIWYHNCIERPTIMTIYPDPPPRPGSPESEAPAGMVDFGRYGLYHCQIDERGLQPLLNRLFPVDRPNGRPRRYQVFEEACRNFWRANAGDIKPAAVIDWIKGQSVSDIVWPPSGGPTYRIIHRAKGEVLSENISRK